MYESANKIAGARVETVKSSVPIVRFRKFPCRKRAPPLRTAHYVLKRSRYFQRYLRTRSFVIIKRSAMLRNEAKFRRNGFQKARMFGHCNASLFSNSSATLEIRGQESWLIENESSDGITAIHYHIYNSHIKNNQHFFLYV